MIRGRVLAGTPIIARCRRQGGAISTVSVSGSYCSRCRHDGRRDATRWRCVGDVIHVAVGWNEEEHGQTYTSARRPDPDNGHCYNNTSPRYWFVKPGSALFINYITCCQRYIYRCNCTIQRCKLTNCMFCTTDGLHTWIPHRCPIGVGRIGILCIGIWNRRIGIITGYKGN